MKSWNAIWCAPIAASPDRVATAPARTNDPMSAVVRMKIHFPSESTRRASRSRSTRLARLEPAQDRDDERRAHPELRDRRPPRRALDPPAEAVHEQHLEDHVHDVPGDDDDERRPQVGDPAQVALPAEREEGRRKPDRGDPEIRDRVVRGLPLAADERDERLREDRDRARTPRSRIPATARSPARRAAAQSPTPRLLPPARPAPSSRTGGS